MFSYYGSKCKIGKYYPKPKYKTIIEPFCGAGWYSLLYNDLSVILNDKNNLIYEIWNWLIEKASAEDILSYTEFYLGENVSTLEIPEPHKNLIGFCINRGSTHPCNIVQKWSCQSKKDERWASTTSYQLKRCAEYLPKVKHWKSLCVDYKDLPDIEATWFIDPPYQNGGQYYKENQVDYKELADWCKSRKGQVIVCENSDADWLDFRPLVEITGQRKKTTEVVWTND